MEDNKKEIRVLSEEELEKVSGGVRARSENAVFSSAEAALKVQQQNAGENEDNRSMYATARR